MQKTVDWFCVCQIRMIHGNLSEQYRHLGNCTSDVVNMQTSGKDAITQNRIYARLPQIEPLFNGQKMFASEPPLESSEADMHQ